MINGTDRYTVLEIDSRDFTAMGSTMTHGELVQRAIKWLAGTTRCRVVASEMSSLGGEIVDAIGWNTIHSWMVECKSNRSDFQADQKKVQRRHPELGVGNFRYYMTAPGLLKPEEIPENWGLLEVHPRYVRQKVRPRRFNSLNIPHRERPMLVRAILRAKDRRNDVVIQNR